ncbi:DUF4129 domain-containing protein [Aquipuribacter sp. MA13-6]|uniref:DUF4129 domain-containing protein n=1 Tax=unclassified Aquipuribacter TaxID=2635084 RepID=UPI003EEE4C34
MTSLLPAVVDPDRETARRWAVEELTDQAYVRAQPNLLQQAITWVLERLDELLTAAGAATGGLGLVVAIALFAALVVLALLLAGPLRRRAGTRRRSDGGVFGATAMTAAQHRSASVQAAADGRWAAAVQERFRATARSLEERVVLDVRPGRTADEVAVEAGALMPDAADGLRRAARAFDDVTYGERPGDEQGYAAAVEADDAVTRSRPAGLLTAAAATP